MWAHGALQRPLRGVGISKDTVGLFVDFVFGEAIETDRFTGFMPEVFARTKWAFAVGHHEIR